MEYIIASHVAHNPTGDEIFGPANSIIAFLDSKKKKSIFIKHDLSGKKPSFVISEGKTTQIQVKDKNIFFRSLAEMRINIKSCPAKKKFCFIGIDPMNGLSGALLKITGKISKFIYLTPDYTESRFSNLLINSIYHLIDRFCLIASDEVWSVSTRIQEVREKQGVPQCKNKLIVNSPDFSKIKQRGYRGSQNLIIISPLSKALDLHTILAALEPLFNKYNKLNLQIVGSGDEEANFKKMVTEAGLNKSVFFLGWRQHHEIFELMQDGFLGFALYTGAANWNTYGDSMKAREYVSCGLPVIINRIPSTADDIQKYCAGLVVDRVDAKEIGTFVEKCLTNQVYYLGLRTNALKLARDNDKTKILSKLLGL